MPANSRRNAFRTVWLACALAVTPTTAGAVPFTIDPSRSFVTLSEASISTIGMPPFEADLLPMPGTDFTRSVGGSFDADPGTGAIASGVLQALGAPITADQMLLGIHDAGDVVISGLGISFTTGNPINTLLGSVTYDLSTGTTRIRRTTPIELGGELVFFGNVVGPSTLQVAGGVPEISVPIDLTVPNLAVTFAHVATFTVSGTIVAVPEPAAWALLASVLALLLAARARPRGSRALRGAALVLVASTHAGLSCPLLSVDQEASLPPVHAVDDAAAVQQGNSVVIRALLNDTTDNGAYGSVSEPMDSSGTVQGSVTIIPDVLSRLEYFAPAGFVGEVTFQYTNHGLGISNSNASSDTGFVTVTVTAGPAPVDAIDDLATTAADTPIEIDVLANDLQDADAIAGFTDAVALGGAAQPGSVSVVSNGGVDQARYAPPAGFQGVVGFEYDIVGAGVVHAAGSSDTAGVTVRVGALARVQFQEASGDPFVEELFFFLGQDAIDQQLATGSLFQTNTATPCVDVPAGIDVPVQAELLTSVLRVVDGSCAQLAEGNDYTVRLIHDGTDFAISCDPGIADLAACIAAP